MRKRLRPFILLLSLLSPSAVRIPTAQATTNGWLIKSSSNSSVYYVADDKRYAFPNEKVFFSWYRDFSGVSTIAPNELASYTLAGNVTYRPGSRLVKITTDPKVYAVSRYGVLRWVTTEQIATALYGNHWNANVDDIPDAFFTNYQVGEPINATTKYSIATELGVTIIAQNIRGIEAPDPVSLSVPLIAGCEIFPADNPWNQDVSQFSVHPNSAAYISSIGSTTHLHPDFGEDPTYGIPYDIVPGTQPKVPVTFDAYGYESDPGPYPIPVNAKIEAEVDAHVLVLDSGACKLYEMYHAKKNNSDSGWTAASGAVWDLRSNDLRPDGWTSADAAGLAILPGLVRIEEVLAGHVNHAIRFTASASQDGFIHPATHHAGSRDNDLPPMGLRVRLKANYDISRLTGQAKPIAEALKTYGMIFADNGSDWYFQGATDPRWNDDDLNQLKTIPGSAFEAVDTGPILR